MQTRERDARRPARSRRAAVISLTLIVALAITLGGIFPFRQMIAQNRQVSLTTEQYELLAAENQKLAERIEILKTPLEVERIAREQYGLVRPGEVGYRTVPVPGFESTPTEADEEEETGDPWYRGIWNFLTGRDLVSDG